MTKESRHRWTIDSIEENVAAIEVDGAHIMFVPVFVLPSGAREGDVLSVLHVREEDRSSLTIEQDSAARAAMLERSRKQASTKAGKDPGGNIVL